MKYNTLLKRVVELLGVSFYKATWPSIVRILGYTLCFILIAKLVLPELSRTISRGDELATHGTRVTPMIVASSNPGWIRDDFESFPDGLNPNIAWVSGSSIRIKQQKDTKGNRQKKELLPVSVNQILESEFGIKSNDYLYLVNARRVLDTYTLVLDALERDADLLVVVINPFWDYNDKAIFYRENVFAEGADKWWGVNDMLWQVMFVSPSDHLYNAIGKYLPFITSPNEYNARMVRRANSFFGIKKWKASETKKGNQGELFTVDQPLQFWNRFRMQEDNFSQAFADLSKSMRWQALAIMPLKKSGFSWSAKILSDMLEKIRNNDVLALIYLAPVSPQLLEIPESYAGYRSVVELLSSLQDDYQSDKISFVVQFPDEVLDSLRFRDFLHLSDKGRLPDHIALKINDLVSNE